MPMAINTFSYWVLGFPLAYMAAITFQAPPSFIWAGFVLGLSAAALLLTARFNTISNKMIAAGRISPEFAGPDANDRLEH